MSLFAITAFLFFIFSSKDNTPPTSVIDEELETKLDLLEKARIAHELTDEQFEWVKNKFLNINKKNND